MGAALASGTFLKTGMKSEEDQVYWGPAALYSDSQVIINHTLALCPSDMPHPIKRANLLESLSLLSAGIVRTK